MFFSPYPPVVLEALATVDRQLPERMVFSRDLVTPRSDMLFFSFFDLFFFLLGQSRVRFDTFD